MKLVSTILCCHKVNRQLFAAIESVLIQNYLKHELIVIFDNENEDDFNYLISRYKGRDNSIIKFFQNKNNMGLTYSLNRAIEISKVSI